MTSLAMLALAVVGFAATLVHNGDFEAGLQGWNAWHPWYEKPQGAGQSTVSAAPGEGRDGSTALKIIGEGKRGLAMQIFPAYPGRYRVSGWIRCEGLEGAEAVVLAEWMSREHQWLSAEAAGRATGTQDWQRFEAILEAHPRARWVHLDLLLSEPTSGTAWFDDIEFERLPSGLPAPAPPEITVATPPGQEGCLQVRWDPAALSPGVVRVLLFCELEGGADELLPRAVADVEEGLATMGSLRNGRTYAVAARAINADGESSALSPWVWAEVTDRQAPRPGWLEAQSVGDGQVRLWWWPHVLDEDVRTVHFVYPADADGRLEQLAEAEVGDLYRLPRPLYCSEPWVTEEVQLPAGVTRVGAWCTDAAGNGSPDRVAWAEVLPVPADAPAPCVAWTAPPTAQLPRDARPPEQRDLSFELLLMRNQAKSFQLMVRPEATMHNTRVRFEALVQEGGAGRIDPTWLAYHFVNYVHLEKNSIATPAEELVWPGPADYPDELSEDRVRDLPAGELQPVFIRVTAPEGTAPGTYRGQAVLECDEGRLTFTVVAQVSPLALPADPRLKFVYWYTWGEPCRMLGVEERSEDGWRVLARLGQLMRTYHQNSVTVPWSLVRTWRRADGTLAHDFSEFDRYVQTFQEQGVGELFCLQHVGGRTTGEWECPTMRSWDQTVVDMRTGESGRMDVVELLPAIEQHLAEKGWLERFAVHVADEPIFANLESYRELAARVKAAAPRLRRMDAIHVPDLRGSLEIWVPQLNYFEQWLEQYRAAQAAGNEMWFYIAWVPQGPFPNRMIDSAAIKPRVLHWLNAIYDTTGYLHWALNHWQISLMSLDSPGDQYITWPSQRYVANSSLRYEAEREGLEDCELLFMLRDALQRAGMTREDAQERMEALARQAVPGIREHTRSWEELERVRREAMEAILAAGT